jgi:hypothetical protein
MPQHLYSDLQCMVRTAIFRVAHTKILDPEHKVLICLLGDDVLEVLFGQLRMIGSHLPNVEVDELHNQIGAALRLDEIFQEYPTWERHPQIPHRLKLKCSRDVDHLSPRNWRGDLCAITCNLSTCWEEGVRHAEVILTRFGYAINFKEFFCNGHKRGVDLMRPRGGKYPGISSEADRSLGEAAEGEDIEEGYSFLLFDGRAAYDAEMEAQQQAESHSIWMDLEEGKPGHKKIILRLFMDPALDLDYNKSHDRLLRVRYFSIGGHSDKWDHSKALSSTYGVPSISLCHTHLHGQQSLHGNTSMHLTKVRPTLTVHQSHTS